MAQSHGDQGAPVAPPPSDLRTAEALGRGVAEVTQQFLRGRAPVTEHTPSELEDAYTSASTHRGD